ncbi:hypothetical protein ACVWZM_002689 [Bradyrhizobium sp. USDA 4501]
MGKAKGDDTPARAAATIELEVFAYTDQQLERIKTAVRVDLGLDVGMLFRVRIELAANRYLHERASTHQGPRRAELVALRKDTERWRARIMDALAVQFKYGDRRAHLMLRQGVDSDMENATRDYFTKLLSNLDRQIWKATMVTVRGDNARKAARDDYWGELLSIWADLDGKPRGVPAAKFLWVASQPVIGRAIPAHKSIVRWLERRATR